MPWEGRLAAIPSARALIILLPIARSVAQKGTRSQPDEGELPPLPVLLAPDDRHGLRRGHVVARRQVGAFGKPEGLLQLDQWGFEQEPAAHAARCGDLERDRQGPDSAAGTAFN